jgi:HPt (histidine-containing phosphotransfer) domain-containing protein
VARAEAVLEQLSAEFPDWMHAECERLDAARREVASRAFTKQTYDALFRAAHDIKDEAVTFGYPAVGAVAHSLCRLIEHAPDMNRTPLALVDQHVDAVRAITREYARPTLLPSPVPWHSGCARSPTTSCAQKTPTGRTIWKIFLRRHLCLAASVGI